MLSKFKILVLIVLCSVLTVECATKSRPIVPRPKSANKYTTVLAIDGGGMKCIVPTMVVIEIENSIKRYLLAHPKLLPEDTDIESEDDFDVLLADYFDAMTGVSAGAWTTSYLASKGGNGASKKVFRRRDIVKKYGRRITPGAALGLEVFFMDFADRFYPTDSLTVNITAPPTLNVTSLPNLTAALANATSLPMTLPIRLPEGSPSQIPFLLPKIDIPGVTSSIYPVDGLEATLKLFLGNVRLSQLSTFYVAHAYDLVQRRNVYFIHDTKERPAATFTSQAVTRSTPRFTKAEFKNGDLEHTPDNSQQDGVDFYVRDIVRGSSAIPAFHKAKTFSPINNANITYTLIDGALVTNNPALQTLIFLNSAPNRIPIKDIAMISLGTGVAYSASTDNADSSLLGWLANNELMSIVSEGSAENVQSQVDFLFYTNPDAKGNQYLRVQIAADRKTTDGQLLTQATNATALPELKEMGITLAKKYRAAIDHFVKNFIFAEK